MSQKDFYQILEIPRSANASEIKKGYLKLAKKYHPDQNPGDNSAEQKFKEVSQAYEVLKDEQKKAAYDALGHDAYMQNASGGGSGRGQHQGNFSQSDINDIFGDFFSDFMGGGQRSRRRGSVQSRGSDLTTKLEITLEEAFKGASKELKYTTYTSCSPCSGRGSSDSSGSTNCSTCGGRGTVRMQHGFFAVEQTCGKCNGAGEMIKNPCTNCNGNGRVQKDKKLIINIPNGIEGGMRIRHAGEGEAGLRGGPSGDLYVVVQVKPHNLFEVENTNLHFKLPLSISKAALGSSIKIPTIEGGQIELKIPAGTETGDRLRVSGKGMCGVKSSHRGDMFAHAFVSTPKNLTKKQRELLQELDKELGDETKFEDPGFFSKMKNLWS